MSKDNEEFKILSPREHVRLRPNMYVGSTSVELYDRFVLGEYKTVKFVPALLKIIMEILDNSCDESIRTQFKFATKIDVSIEDNKITITDNGRGIPQDDIVDENGITISKPEAAWTRVNSGTSFSDERTTGGANGVGSSCANFMSKVFVGKTWRDGTAITVACSDGGLNIKTTKSKKVGNGTTVTFEPDFSLLECDNIQQYDTIELLKDRLLSLSMCFPEIKFTFNGSKIYEEVSNFTTYAKLFGPKDGSQYSYANEEVSFLIAGSVDGYRQNFYVNGINAIQGGTYNDYIINGIVEELLPMIKRKYKVEVNKTTIKNGITIVVFARNFVNPKYEGQTKERLTNTMAQVRDHFNNSFKYDMKYLAKKIIDMEDVIGPIVEAQLNKKKAEEARETEINKKKLKKIKVAKHVPATDMKNATLFLTEGDSAGATIIEVRKNDSKTGSIVGYFPLRGVVKNVWTDSTNEILKNKEISELISILELDITDKESYKNMSYKNIAILADSDVDGHKITTLVVAMIQKTFPGIITDGRLKIARSPILIATKGKETKWFYNLKDAEDLKNKGGWYFRYIKGLGSLEKEEYDIIINNPTFDVVTVSDPKYFEIMFGDDSDIRKEYLTK